MSYQSVSSYLNFDLINIGICAHYRLIVLLFFALCWLTTAISDFRMGAVGFSSRHFLIYEMYSTYTVDRVYIYIFMYIYILYLYAYMYTHIIYIMQYAFNIFAHAQMHYIYIQVFAYMYIYTRTYAHASISNIAVFAFIAIHIVITYVYIYILCAGMCLHGGEYNVISM